MDIITQILEKNRILFVSLVEFTGYAVFLSLIIYHLIVYWGRKKFRESKYYLYFAYFLTGLLFYIFTDTHTFYILLDTIAISKKWIPFLTAVCFLIMYKSIILLLNSFLDISPKKKSIVHSTFNIYALLNLVWLAPIVLSKGWRPFFSIFWYFSFLFAAFLAIVYLGYLWKNKQKVETSIKIIAWLIICYVVYIIIYRKTLMSTPKELKLLLWIVNDSMKIVVVFVFAYALARTSNKEFLDLQELKNNLKKKVEEKTLELRLAKEQIEEINRQKTNYFVNLSHETKTPLTLISNYLDRYIKINGTSKELIIIRDNFNKLKEDMIRFLDVEKYEKGLVVYDHEHIINLSDCLNRKTCLFREHAMLHNLNIVFEIDQNVYVNADPSAIERMVNNLFDNAVKFTGGGGKIDIQLLKTATNVQFKVKDTGMGIEKDRLENIFRPYYQASQAKVNSQGLGMGLFIVKNVVEELKGTIHVNSKIDVGTEFIVTLPLADNIEVISNIAEIPGMDNKSAIESNLISKLIYVEGRANIMVVEDNTDMRNYLCEELNEKYNVFCANNGKTALEILKTLPAIGLILCDVMMDEMDGYEFYENISKISKYALTPFIFLTARSRDNEKIEMLSKGVSEYLFKPFSIEELKAKIQSVLLNAQNQRKAGLQDAVQAIQNVVQPPSLNSHSKWAVFENKQREYELTERQVEIIKLIEEGMEYKEIADKLNLSVKTVHRHIENLFEKVSVHSKIELLKKMFEK